MPRYLTLPLMAIVLFPPPAQAWAWNDVGHRLVAMIAWEMLDDATRQEVVRVLRHHERFEPDFAEPMPAGLSPADEAKWIFAQASVWPDVVRGFSGDLRTQFHRPTWHYINQPIYLNDADRRFFESNLPVNVTLDLPATRRDDELNIVQALKLTRIALRESTSDRERALRLCWLSHLVGDLHQPMHASALFSRTRFPEGDRGGNDIRLGPRDNLHRHWDDMLGNVESPRQVSRRAQRLVSDSANRRLGERARGGRIEDWLAESRRLAEGVAYHPSILAAVQEAERTGEAGPVNAELPSEYDRRAKPIARQRAIQAGFRLAMLIEQAGFGSATRR